MAIWQILDYYLVMLKIILQEPDGILLSGSLYLILNCNSRTKRLLNTIMVKEMYCKKFFFGSEITRTELVFFPLFRSTMQFVICRQMIFVSRVYWITKTQVHITLNHRCIAFFLEKINYLFNKPPSTSIFSHFQFISLLLLKPDCLTIWRFIPLGSPIFSHCDAFSLPRLNSYKLSLGCNVWV